MRGVNLEVGTPGDVHEANNSKEYDKPEIPISILKHTFTAVSRQSLILRCQRNLSPDI